MASQKIVLKLKLWGVRGSIPTPLTDEQVRIKQAHLLEHVYKKIQASGGLEAVFGKKPTTETFMEYMQDLDLSMVGTLGGNTSCFEIQGRNSPLCIVDAGSGIRHLGNHMLQSYFQKKSLNPLSSEDSAKREVNLFLTHYHWDHIQGLPFFAPAFMHGLEIRFFGQNSSTVQLNEVLRGQQESQYFPVSWTDLPCIKECTELPRFNPQPLKFGDATVIYRELDHPGGSFGYAFEIDNYKVAIIGDTEHREIPPPNAMDLARNASVIYWDAQYLPEEYRGESGMSKYGWGHSTYEFGVRCALAAGSRCVLIGHHEPMRCDRELLELQKRARKYRDQLLKEKEHKGKKLEVFIAQEGMAAEVSAEGKLRIIFSSGLVKEY